MFSANGCPVGYDGLPLRPLAAQVEGLSLRHLQGSRTDLPEMSQERGPQPALNKIVPAHPLGARGLLLLARLGRAETPFARSFCAARFAS
jgi:hypothetical protein